MAILKITEYQIGQDKAAGFAGFKVKKSDGSISDWIGSPWFRVPFPQFSSLVVILMSGNAFYDDVNGSFLMRSNANFSAFSTEGAVNESSFDVSDSPKSPVKIIKLFNAKRKKKTSHLKTIKTKK